MTNGQRLHPVRDQGLVITCENGHQQTIYLPDHSETEARMLGAIMDGTSDFFVSKPREHPLEGSRLAKCGICDAWFTCQIFGYEQ